MEWRIFRADGRHKRDINRLIKTAKIGSGIKGPVPRDTWVARVGDKVIGYASLDFVGNKAAILEGMVVERGFRHQGIGSTLISRRMKVARRRGIKVFALCTMYYLFNFYKRRGFRTCPRDYLPGFLKTYTQFTERRYKKCAVMVKGISIKRPG